MLLAAKEEMLSPLVPCCAETCISARESEGEKPHQGVATKKSAHFLGHEVCNSTTALGLRGQAALNRVGSRCTGKERDAESNLDNFDFRYYSSSMGRFTKPDEPFAGWDQNNPQSLNLYSYVQNNPVVNVDPDGHDCIYFSSAGNPSVKSGDCISDKDSGIYVNGTVDPGSLNYNNGSWGYSYTAYDSGNIGTGTIGNAPAPGPEPKMDNGAVSPGFLGPGDIFFMRVPNFGIMAKIGEWLGIGEKATVIGKMADLEAKGAIKSGERALADDLADLGSPKANWAQNSSKLREVMSKVKPIRDASAGKPGSNTGFLRAERNVLQNHGWTLQGDTWVPPSK